MEERKIIHYEALHKFCGAVSQFLETVKVRPEHDFPGYFELFVKLCDDVKISDTETRPCCWDRRTEIDGIPLRVSIRLRAGKGRTAGKFASLKPYAVNFLGLLDAGAWQYFTPSIDLYLKLYEAAHAEEAPDKTPDIQSAGRSVLRFSIDFPRDDEKKLIGKKFSDIRRARELAFLFLCSLEIYPDQNFDEALEFFMNTQDDKPAVKERCRTLAAEVWNRKREIDGVLLRVVTGWRPERMLSVDRTILRLIVLEGFLLKTLPVGSAMSEARNLAEDYGTKDSPRFVKGVIFRAAKYFEAQHNAE